MIRLLFVVPYPELEHIIDYILRNHPERQRIWAKVLVRSVDEVEQLPVRDFDAVIARGYSARQLQLILNHYEADGIVIKTGKGTYKLAMSSLYKADILSIN